MAYSRFKVMSSSSLLSIILLLLLLPSTCRAGYINLKAIHPGSDIDGQGIRINSNTGTLIIQSTGNYFTGNLTQDKILHVAALTLWTNSTIQADLNTGILGAVNNTSTSTTGAAFDISGGDLVLNGNSTFLACPLSNNNGYNVSIDTNQTSRCSGAIEIALQVGTYDGQSPTDTLPSSTSSNTASSSTTPTASAGDSENFILLAIHSGSDVSNKAISYDNSTGKLYINRGSEFIGRISNGILRDNATNDEISILSDGSLGNPSQNTSSASSIFSLYQGHLRLNGSPNFVACADIGNSSTTSSTSTSSTQDSLRTSSSLNSQGNIYGIFNGTVTCSGGISLILQVIESVTNSNASLSESSISSLPSSSLVNSRIPSSSSLISSSSPSSSASSVTASASKSSSSNSGPVSTSSSSIYALIGFTAVALFTL